jgi:hypothetical protein
LAPPLYHVRASDPPQGLLDPRNRGHRLSLIILQFLNRGCKVRGTVRDISKAKWLTEDLFASEAASGFFEVVAVPDMSAENSFDEP